MNARFALRHQATFESKRADFPILSQKHHDDIPLIYLDNGASSQKPNCVIDAMTSYYHEHHANVHRGIHKLSDSATTLYEGARDKVRRFINAASRREVIFTRGTTEGINLVANTWGRTNLGPGDVVVLSLMEHHANIVPWQILAQQCGFTVEYLSLTPDGTLDMNRYEQLLTRGNVRLVAVMHVSNVLGTVNPIQHMASLAHAHGALMMVDAAQSVPHQPVDVQALDCDFLVFSSHKMAGPTGIGVLYGKRDLLEAMPPWIGGGDMIATVTLAGSTWNDLPYKFEAGTPSIAEAVGLGAAVDYLTQLGMGVIHDYVHDLTTYLYEGLRSISHLSIIGPAERSSLVSFIVDGIHAHDVAQYLDQRGIAVRAGHHCAMPLHTHYDVAATTRASCYFYNTLDEISALLSALEQLPAYLGPKRI